MKEKGGAVHMGVAHCQVPPLQKHVSAP